MFKKPYDCCGCSACFAVCPKNCIKMKLSDDGFYTPYFNAKCCVDCNMCVDVCPLKHPQTNNAVPLAYGAITKDSTIRHHSSSGGLFTVLANEVIKLNGVVFGAIFNEKFNVVHHKAETYDELKAFRGSKYVQCDTNNSFKEVKSLLENDRFVYFSGTPCQIAGLKAYLKKDYDKLITQDIICHSTPSVGIWNIYMNSKEKEYGGKLVNVNFRVKDKGIHGYKLLMKFDNGKTYTCDNTDPYISAFLSGYSSNSACYNCHFKNLSRISDFTLGDFWGVEKLFPSLDDGGGVSLMLLHTEKAKKLFETIKDDIIFVETDPEAALKKNQMASKAIAKPYGRERFFRYVRKLGIEEAMTKASKRGLLIRTYKKLRSFYKRTT